MIIQEIDNCKMPLIVPPVLRTKTVNSQTSREIFFIDCLNDLSNCARSGISYHLTRSSVLLRMLLLDGGLNTIADNYDVNIEFEACSKKIEGIPLSGTKIRNIKKTLKEYRYGTGSYSGIKLITKPLKKHSLEEFNEKICLTMRGNENFSFSIQNIINLVANKSGAAHLESSFDSSNIEAFHFAEFNPFSITGDNFFLEKLKEIILILYDAIYPLAKEVVEHLILYNNSFSQGKGSITAKAISVDKTKKKK
jgi:hypothetical protein